METCDGDWLSNSHQRSLQGRGTIMDNIDAHVESWTAVLHVMVGPQRTQDFASDKPSENARLSVKLECHQ